MTTLFNKNLLIGTSNREEEGKIKISLTIKEEKKQEQTIDHKLISNYKTLSMSGEIWQKNGRDITIGGQCYDELNNLSIYKILNISEQDLKTII